eukprot:maker-scaffold199_size265817-snap-gene-1.56 protein:Tk08952 transcript:maker-scaffold199_size265817-snap-gene-1.56-mRNA-1 annotation:"chymotrypsin-like protein"
MERPRSLYLAFLSLLILAWIGTVRCSTDLDLPDFGSLVPQPLQSAEILEEDNAKDEDFQSDDDYYDYEDDRSILGSNLPLVQLNRSELFSSFIRSHTGQRRCGRNLPDLVIGESGDIFSPNFPEKYPSNSSCIWRLSAPKMSLIELNCSHVVTEECTPKNLKDYLLFNPDPNKDEYYLICGKYQASFHIRSFTNEALVYFRSSPEVEFSGFSCRWRVVDITHASENTIHDNDRGEEGDPGEKQERQFNGDEGCGEPTVRSIQTTRIVGGTEAQKHEFPWLVGISFNKKWFCGGTLISDQWILTAAHCTVRADSSYVYLGAHNIYEKEEGRVIMFSEEFYEHPDYRDNVLANDVALIKLPRKVTYSEKIMPICLPLRNEEADDSVLGQFMITAGWGLVEAEGKDRKISRTLNKLKLHVISNKQCRRTYGSKVRPTNICAQNMGDRSSTCQGDSGGALQNSFRGAPWIQHGIVSFGPDLGCGKNHPNGYSRVSHFLDFIGNVTGNHYV